jgi:hypothetical protein
METIMAFNVHISRIVENTSLSNASSKVDHSKDNQMAMMKTYKSTPSLVNVPTGNVIPKYPVRIFEVRAED